MVRGRLPWEAASAATPLPYRLELAGSGRGRDAFALGSDLWEAASAAMPLLSVFTVEGGLARVAVELAI